MKLLSPYIQTKLCDALLALLGDETPPTCLANYAQCLFLLDLYKKEIPDDLLNELHAIMDEYVEIGDEGHIRFRAAAFSNQEKTELAERLLSIYIDVRGGVLIF